MKTEKTKVKRIPKRGIYDKESIYKILDNNYICHIGFVHKDYPVVIPTAYGRLGDELILHGSAASRMMKDLATGINCCVTVSKVKGLVLAKSAFHHSMNYESVVVFGKAMLITDPIEKIEALKVLTNHIVKDRWEEVRAVSEKELKGTTVLKISLHEASAKVRDAGPADDKADDDLQIWTGVVPIVSNYLNAIPVDAHLEMPASVKMLKT